MPGVCSARGRDGKPLGKFRFWYIDKDGKRRWRMGTADRRETLAIARHLEAQHREVREQKQLREELGLPALDQEGNALGTYAEAVAQYLAWGNLQGGRGGRPWGKTHARNRKAQLAWWGEKLRLHLMRDLVGALPLVEQALVELRDEGEAPKPGKTLQNRAESIRAFCRWCVDRSYLARDPLEKMRAFDTTPATRRRAATVDELRALLQAAPVHRRMLYEVAINTGLRANELRSLGAEHLVIDHGAGVYALRLDAAWTKDRKGGLQPIPRDLAERLSGSVTLSEARTAYERARWKRWGALPEHPLLYVPTHTARDLGLDLKAAKVEKWTVEGKLDFHALRVAYDTLLFELGASVKEAQELMRHSTPHLTTNTYARVRRDNLAALAERIGCTLSPDAPDVRKHCANNESAPVTPLGVAGYGGGGGNRTDGRLPPNNLRDEHSTGTYPTLPVHNQTQSSAAQSDEIAGPAHPTDTPEHGMCKTCANKIPKAAAAEPELVLDTAAGWHPREVDGGCAGEFASHGELVWWNEHEEGEVAPGEPVLARDRTTGEWDLKRLTFDQDGTVFLVPLTSDPKYFRKRLKSRPRVELDLYPVHRSPPLRVAGDGEANGVRPDDAAEDTTP